MVVLKIKEMSCNHCVERIHKLLEELNVEHDIQLESKTVTLKEGANIDVVISELDDIGFTATR